MNKAIILAAGESYDTSDIFPKILLKNPITNETIIESFQKNYGENTLFVLGFRALSILNMHPNINVVLNHSWAITKSAYSLSLAINCLSPNEIVDIYSGDYFIEDEFFNEFKENKAENILVASFRESRSKKACNLKIDQGIIKRDIPTKRKVRDTLIRYQETSEHGAVWGKHTPCGPKSSPSFTFKQK